MASRRKHDSTSAARAIFIVVAVAVLTIGVFRLAHHHFGVTQAIYCLLAIAAAWFLLLLGDYTLHHARVAFVAVLAILLLLAFQSPAFCVGLGAALGAVAWSER